MVHLLIVFVFNGVCVKYMVVTSPCVMQKTPFAAAYYYHDDLEYYRLRSMFIDDISPGAAVEIIVISSSSEDGMYSSEGTKYMDVDNEDDEVNSPAIFPKSTVRRKLFDQEAPLTDMDSVTSPQFHFIDVTPGPSFRARYQNIIPKPFASIGVTNVVNMSPFGSSCASNSPMAFWHRGDK